MIRKEGGRQRDGQVRRMTTRRWPGKKGESRRLPGKKGDAKEMAR